MIDTYNLMTLHDMIKNYSYTVVVTETTLYIQVIPQGTPLFEAEVYPLSKVCIHSVRL